MKNIKSLFGRGSLAVIALAFFAAVVFPAVGPAQIASAGVLTSRKVTLGSAADGNTSTDANSVAVPAGAGGNGAQTKHTFNFTTPSTTNVGSIVFMYCTTPFADTACTPPTGLDTSTVNAITSPTFTNPFTFDTTTDTTTATGTGYFATDTNACTAGSGRTNCILINKGTTNSETAGAKAVTFGASGGWLKNPTSNGTYYVRILTFTDNAYTTQQDNGTVAFAITDEINITAMVQEQLKFSVSTTTNAPTTSCIALPATGSISLGNSGVLDTSTAYDAHSYFRVSTNAANGTAVQYSAGTLRTATGGFTITAPTGPTASTVGSEQFGLGFDSADATADGWSVTHLLTRASPYNSANGTITNAGTATFGFSATADVTPVQIASTTGATIVTCDTLSVRYIANIAPVTEPGIYRTTVAYIATPTY